MKVSKLWVSGVLAAILIWAVPAFAEQMWVHGTEGRIEYVGRAFSYWGEDRTVFGWGLQFEQEYGQDNVIHYAVPTKSGTTPPSTVPWGARYIYIDCATGSSDAGIKAVTIYNGKDEIKTVTYSTPKTGAQYLTIDLGAKTLFTRGLGVSIGVGAGTGTGAHWFWFRGVGANFIQ